MRTNTHGSIVFVILFGLVGCGDEDSEEEDGKYESPFTVVTLDSNVGTVENRTSLTLDSAGAVHIAYHTLPGGDLRYATNTSGSWQTDVIESFDPGITGEYPSIAVDSSDVLHIAYYSFHHFVLRHASNQGGSWTFEEIESDAGEYCSMDINQSDEMAICYLGNGGGLRCAISDDTEWSAFVADYAEGVGRHVALAYDYNGEIHAAYYDMTNNAIKYGTTASGSWTTETAIQLPSEVSELEYDSAGIDLDVDSSGTAYITYFYGHPYERVKVASRNLEGAWESQDVDLEGDSSGEYLAMTIDGQDFLHLSYMFYAGAGTPINVRYATNRSGKWELTPVDPDGYAGWYPSIAVGDDGTVHISYVSSNNGLRYATLAPSE